MMRRNFNEIMSELTGLLNKQAMDDPSLTGGGPDIVNKEKGEVGASTTTIPSEAKGDVSLRVPHKDGDVLSYEKEKAYPDRLRNPDSSSKELEKSRLGDDDMGLEDQPEKKAALMARRLLSNIDSLLNENLGKSASHNQIQHQVDALALQKAASFEAGREAASQWLDYIEKFAEDSDGESGPQSNSPSHRGDLEGTAVSRLIPATDPHDVSENKSPESEPSSSGDKKAPKLMQGNAQVDSSLGDKNAEVLILKAQLYDDFVKAAQVGDEAAMAIAKANMFDFIQAYGV